MTLWKGRFEKPMGQAMARISRSLSVDFRLLPYELEVDRVYAEALRRVGVLDADGVVKIHDAIDCMLREYAAGKYNHAELQDEDIHSFVERRLIALAGSEGAKIHTGRSRNDLILTDVCLFLRDQCRLIISQIHSLGRAILKQADRNAEIMMPAYTHMQRAQPIYLSHYLYSFCFSLLEDSRRIERVLEGPLTQLPLGAGAVAGSAFPIDREWIAGKLGFSGVTENSIQTVSNRDELLELAGAFSILMVHLSRYAEDLIVWSTEEFGFVRLDDSVSTGSSMMPQKRNPDSLELIRGKAARVIGRQQTLFTLLKGLPLTYARDLQEDKPAIFDIVEQVGMSLEVFADVMSTVQFNADKMKAALSLSLMATDLADYLVKKGVPFRESHEIVAKLFRSKREGERITLDRLKESSPLFDSDAEKLLDPTVSTGLREIRGGTAPASIREQRKILKRYFLL